MYSFQICKIIILTLHDPSLLLHWTLLFVLNQLEKKERKSLDLIFISYVLNKLSKIYCLYVFCLAYLSVHSKFQPTNFDMPKSQRVQYEWHNNRVYMFWSSFEHENAFDCFFLGMNWIHCKHFNGLWKILVISFWKFQITKT